MEYLKYKFEPMIDGTYQVRLNGEFVCYRDDENSKAVDQYLKESGFSSREDYLIFRLKQYL